jgi:hypothetical protein
MVYRDPTGVYAEGGCIDLSRDSFSALSNISERMQSV